MWYKAFRYIGYFYIVENNYETWMHKLSMDFFYFLLNTECKTVDVCGWSRTESFVPENQQNNPFYACSIYQLAYILI